MKTIKEVFESFKVHPFYSKDFKKLKPIQIEFMLKYLEEKQNFDHNQFHHDLNRLFIINKIEAGYDYDRVFPLNKKDKRPLVSTAQDIMGSVFNMFKREV